MKGLLVGNVCAPLLSSLRFVAGRADASKEVHGWEGRIGGRLGVAVLRGRAGTDVQVTRVVCTESCDMSVVHVACSDRIWVQMEGTDLMLLMVCRVYAGSCLSGR